MRRNILKLSCYGLATLALVVSIASAAFAQNPTVVCCGSLDGMCGPAYCFNADPEGVCKGVDCSCRKCDDGLWNCGACPP